MRRAVSKGACRLSSGPPFGSRRSIVWALIMPGYRNRHVCAVGVSVSTSMSAILAVFHCCFHSSLTEYSEIPDSCLSGMVAQTGASSASLGEWCVWASRDCWAGAVDSPSSCFRGFAPAGPRHSSASPAHAAVGKTCRPPAGDAPGMTLALTEVANRFNAQAFSPHWGRPPPPLGGNSAQRSGT